MNFAHGNPTLFSDVHEDVVEESTKKKELFAHGVETITDDFGSLPKKKFVKKEPIFGGQMSV